MCYRVGSVAMTLPPVTTSLPETDRLELEIAWLQRPRWGVMAIFLVTLLLAQLGVVQAMAPVPVMLGAGVTALSNLGVPHLSRRIGIQPLTLSLLVFDALVLTLVLFFSGGATNPLSALYLTPIALSAVVLPARQAWTLPALTVTAFFVLFFSPEFQEHELELAHASHHGQAELGPSVFNLHLRGMWVAFSLTAGSVAYFVTQVATALRLRERELVNVRARAFRAERVASLASLAASTAHELGTPLASIQLAASEMMRAIERGAAPKDLAADAQLVHGEVRRCREILDSMLNEAGETVGEVPIPQDAGALLRAAIATLPESERGRVELTEPGSVVPLHTPPRIVTQALHNLIRNALDASPMDRPVKVAVREVGDHVEFEVSDQGLGMDHETLQRALEPFVTTKPGRGKGLGLFLTSSVAERLGGDLRLESSPGRGTRAVFDIRSTAVTRGGDSVI